MASIQDLVSTIGKGGTIFAVSPFTPTSDAVVVMRDVDDIKSDAPGYDYLLECRLAMEAIEVWSAWRDGRTPSRREAAEAVIYYAVYDAWLPETT